ncbi:TrmH family RNA methyltransferase [Promineifilum sp.]|uniref:TrmH family RNA methyltransferase n=1 Tax=Promineifilum sp. TaxID=2664178 RepID=UPI0035AF80E2
MSTLTRPSGLIEMIRRAHSARGRQATGLYAIEGVRLVERALRAGAPLAAVLAAESLAADPRRRDLLAALRAAGCPVTVAPDAALITLTEGRDLGLILGLVRLPEPIRLSDLLVSRAQGSGGAEEQGSLPATTDQLPTIADLLPAPPLPCPPAPLLLAAIDITDPGNAGALTRTAHATGARALLAVGASDPFHPRATRISRGSIFKLPVIAYADAAALLADLRANGVAAIATTAAGGAPLPDVVWPVGPLAVLMGNEAEGLPAAVQAAVDLQVTIPMAAGVDSYSVNAAAAIILYEISTSA